MKNIYTVILILLAACTINAAESISLFDGKDLSHWEGDGYVIKDGVLICTPKGRNLMTKKQYSNYIFELQFKLPPGGNNGLGIHYPGKGDPAYTGVEIQILDDSHPKYKKLDAKHCHGAIYFFQAPKKGFLKPVGEWNRQVVTVIGDKVKVELNGTIINDANLAELSKSRDPNHKGIKRRSGHIALCGHGDKVEFRDIKITELPKNSEVVGLFNGKDLQHWNGEGYEIEGDTLICTSKGRKLFTKKEYRNYIFEFQFKLLPGSNNGIGIHYPGNGTPAYTGLEIQILDNSHPKYKKLNAKQFHGSIYFFKAAKKGFLKPVGEWNHQVITVIGSKVKVELNGTVINYADLDKLRHLDPNHKGLKRRSGHIALCGHGEKIEFRDIKIIEFDKTRLIKI